MGSSAAFKVVEDKAENQEDEAKEDYQGGDGEEVELIEVAIDYAMQFVGIPYIWGGNNPVEGFDCSGFVQEVLASMGLDPKGDQTAQALFNHFLEHGQLLESPEAGSLVFYGKDASKISHVSFCINEWQIIEAGGGGRNCRTSQDAAAAGAYVRVRSIDARADIVSCIYPFSLEE